MTAVTNTVQVPVPDCCDLAATRLVFERFGEVAKVVDVPGAEPPKAAVVFFDVRSATRAIETLGAAYCVPGPQTGSRTVRLPGNGNFDMDDIASISAAFPAEDEEGAFVLEFFDLRDAARYREHARSEVNKVVAPMVPAAPANLRSAAPVAAPPGLEPQKPVMSRVHVRGIPSKLLSSTMVEVMLEAAGVSGETVVGFSTKASKTHGKLTVNFSCTSAAEACAEHFRQCQWGLLREGLAVELCHVGGADGAALAPACEVPTAFESMVLDMDAVAFENVWAAGEVPLPYSSEEAASLGALSEETPSTSLSAEAAEWTPASSRLTAEAPEFVPGKLFVERFGAAKKGNGHKKGPHSETSTEFGESEDEKAAAAVPAA